ncbi:hypothetical protein ABH926_003367 [Catenulispora sp. GP43]|uniref:hypothetical protein n=1 Tax=Catenulispora sp. GP43 TaxID=3156263 RepID=UPI00351863DE
MDDSVINGVVSTLTGALAAYGTNVLTTSETAAADASVGLARRVWARIRHHSDVAEAVEAVAAHPGDEDYEAVLRTKLAKSMQREPELARDLGALLGIAVTASGDHSIAVQTNHGILSTGDNATNVQFGA